MARIIRITPDPRDGTQDFNIDEDRIGSVVAQGLADYSPDTKGYIPRDDSKRRMLARFKTQRSW